MIYAIRLQAWGLPGVTQEAGVSPTRASDARVDWTMPRWQMTEEDQNDLLAYLKTLK